MFSLSCHPDWESHMVSLRCWGETSDEGFLTWDCPYKGFNTAQNCKTGQLRVPASAMALLHSETNLSLLKTAENTPMLALKYSKSGSCLFTCSLPDRCHHFASEWSFLENNNNSNNNRTNRKHKTHYSSAYTATQFRVSANLRSKRPKSLWWVCSSCGNACDSFGSSEGFLVNTWRPVP